MPDKDNSTDDEKKGVNRRNLIKTIGAAGVAGLGLTGASGGAAAQSTPQTTRVSGETRSKYLSRAHKQLQSQENYSALRARLASQDYTVTTDGGLVTKRSDTGEYSVLLPVVKNGSTLDGISDSDAKSGSTGSGTQAMANFVWNSGSPNKGSVIRTGPVKDLVPDSLLTDVPSNAHSNNGIEVMKTDAHDVTFLSKSTTSGSTSGVSAESTSVGSSSDISAYSVNVDNQTVTNEDAGASTQGMVTTQSSDCPSSISAILAALTACAGSAAVCESVLEGDLPGLIGCLGVATCGCGVGCCLGQAGYPGVCTYATTVITAGTLVFSAGEVAAAYCIQDGCNGKNCVLHV